MHAVTSDTMVPVASELRRGGTIEERVAAAQDDLAPSEREVADYFVTHRDEVPFMSALQIAEALGTSNATVVRAAQSLGYAGLPDLKQVLATACRSSRQAARRV